MDMSLKILKKQISGVRIYWDQSSFRTEYGRRKYLHMKPCHDKLYQRAIDLYLAKVVLVMERDIRPLAGLEDISGTLVERATWWPANETEKATSNLLYVPLYRVNRDWLNLRHEVERGPKDETLWHDDPALVDKVGSSSLLLCRTASIGHEGCVFYFVYPHEDEWEDAVRQHAFDFFGSGEKAYRSLVPNDLRAP